MFFNYIYLPHLIHDQLPTWLYKMQNHAQTACSATRESTHSLWWCIYIWHLGVCGRKWGQWSHIKWITVFSGTKKKLLCTDCAVHRYSAIVSVIVQYRCCKCYMVKCNFNFKPGCGSYIFIYCTNGTKDARKETRQAIIHSSDRQQCFGLCSAALCYVYNCTIWGHLVTIHF